MSAASTIVKNTFEKVFTNLAKKNDTPVEKTVIQIYYEKGVQKYNWFDGRGNGWSEWIANGCTDKKKEKDFEIDEYTGTLLDWSGGTAILETTIAQAGAKYAKELNSEIDGIKIIMEYKKDSLPNAVLFSNEQKVRNVNIEKEFLT